LQQNQLHERACNIAERCGADIEKLRVGIGSDPRIGYSFIYPGAGLRGLLFSEGCAALIRSAREFGHSPEILDRRRVGERPPEAAAGAQDQAAFRQCGLRADFALWALPLSLTPTTCGEAHPAPSSIACGRGCERAAYDPVAGTEAQRIYGDRPIWCYAKCL